MKMKKIYVNHKRMRAAIIKTYLGNKKAFCFSCGNATKALKQAGVNLIPIGPKEQLQAKAYIEPNRAFEIFECFNATSGCIPTFLIDQLATLIRPHIPEPAFSSNLPIYVPVGSGELLFALMHIFPMKRLKPFTSSYGPLDFSNQTPLACFIHRNFEIEHLGDKNIDAVFESVKEYPGYFIYTEEI